MEIVWLIVFIVLLGFELASLALTTIWFAGGALVSFFVALCNGSIELQLVVFVITSLLLLFFTRPFLVKYVNNKTTKTNVEELIGQKAVVSADIDNLQAAGAVEINGVEWTARAADAEEKIQKGKVVQIKEIKGVKLIVTPVKEERYDG